MQNIADRREEMREIGKALGEEGFSLIVIEGEEGVGKSTLLRKIAADFSAVMHVCSPSGGERDAIYSLLRAAGMGDVISETYGEVLAVYGVHRETGVLIGEATRSTSLDGDIFAGMLTAVQAFVRDSLNMLESSEGGYLSSLEYGEYRIIVARGKYLDLVAIVRGAEEFALKSDMLRSLKEFEEIREEKLKSWDGNVDSIGIKPLLERYLGKTRPREDILLSSIIAGLRDLLRERIIAIDDAQWIDRGSLMILKRVLSIARSEDFGKIILSVQAGVEGGEMEDILDGATCRINLRNMEGEAIIEFVNHYFPDNTFSQEFYQDLERCTSGNPMRMIAVLNKLREEGMIRNEEGFWICKEFQCPRSPVPLPSLSDEEMEIAEISAAIGFAHPEFLSTLLDLPMFKVIKILRRLTRKGLLAKADGEYAFTHDSIMREILEGMDPDEIRYYRLAAGEFFERDKPERAARILENLDRERSGELYEMLARRAEMDGKYREAAAYFVRASRQTGKRELLRRAAFLLRKIGDYRAAMKLYAEIRDTEDGEEGYVICAAMRGMIVETDNPHLRKKAEAIVAYREGNFQKSLDLAKDVLNEREDFDMHLIAGECLSYLGLDPGEHFSRARELAEHPTDTLLLIRKELSHLLSRGYAEEVLSRVDEDIERAREMGSWREVAALINLKANALISTGRIGEGIQEHLHALRYAEMQDDENLTSIILGNIALQYISMGEYEKALKYQRRVLNIFRAVGNRHGVAFTKLDMGQSYLGMGRWKEAEKYLEESLRELEEVGDKDTALYTKHYLLALRFAMSGDCKLAREMARVYEDFKKLGDFYPQIELAIIQAMVDRVCNSTSTARRDLEENRERIADDFEAIIKAIESGELKGNMEKSAFYRRLVEMIKNK